MRAQICTIFVGLTVQASAAILQYTASGTWGADVTPNQWVQPNASWSFSVLTSSNQNWMNIDKTNNNWNFDIAFTSFHYVLAGTTVITNPVAIRIEDPAISEGPGMFIYFQRVPPCTQPNQLMCLDPTHPSTFDQVPVQGFELIMQPQTQGQAPPNLYALGPDSQPYLLTGQFPLGDFGTWDSEFRNQPAGTFAHITGSTLSVTVVPEPTNFGLLGGILFATVLLRRKGGAFITGR